MSFFRHREIFRSDMFDWSGDGANAAPGLIGCDEFPAGYSSADCSPVWGHMIHGQNAEGTQHHNGALGAAALGRVCSGALFEPVRPVWPRVA